jgi:V8-like Glu-specific endopeptidase
MWTSRSGAIGYWMGAALGCLAGAGCSSAPLETGEAVTEPATGTGETELAVPADWVGREIGVPVPRLRRVGRVESKVDARVAAPVVERAQVVNSARDAEAQRALVSQIRAMGPDGSIYDLLASSGEIHAVAERLRQAGGNGASQRSDPPTRTLSLSNGIDSRVRWPNTSSDFPRDTIGKVGLACTGTLFEQRLVLTAFHCLLTKSGGWVSDATFSAGRDSGINPYGTVDHVWKYWDQAFIDGRCYDPANYTENCAKYDWAVLVLGSTPTASNGARPGYMGFAAQANDTLVANYAMYHAGYAGCLDPEPPKENGSCVYDALWHQTFTCSTGTFTGAVNGWNRLFWHGCDATAGHSGGALYSWSPGSNGPYIVATHVGSNASDPHSANPNLAFRLDQGLFDAMLYWRSIY